MLTYASPGWFPFLCNTATNHLEVLHRAACRVITGCLSSTPSSLLLLEAQLPPLKLTLEHQTLYSFERALRLPPVFSSLYALAIKNVPCRLKKKPSWRSFCSSVTQPLPSPRETLITCPPFLPWSTTHFTVSPLHSRLHRQQYSPTPNCFKQTILHPPVWYPNMDWRICPLTFWSRWYYSVCNMLQMQHIQFLVLFHWSNCLQLHSWNLCPQARSCLVY